MIRKKNTTRKFYKIFFNNCLEIVYFLLYYTGIEYILSKLNNKIPFKVIMYHSVNDEKNSPAEIGISITKKKFKKQIKYLQNRYNIISMEMLVNYFYKNASLPKNSLLITFDDGFSDNYNNAFPILKKYNLPATIFLTSSFIDTNKILPLIMIYYGFENTKKKSIVVNYKNLDINRKNENAVLKYKLNKKWEKIKAIEKARKIYKQLSYKESVRFTKIIMNKLDVSTINNDSLNMLKTDQIKEMQKYGISFGSHTMNHTILTKESEKNIESELIGSKIDIETILNYRIDSLAYPDGGADSFNKKIRSIVQKTGYSVAFTAYNDNKENNKPYEIRRYGCIPDQNIYKFACYLSGIFFFIDKVRERFRIN